MKFSVDSDYNSLSSEAKTEAWKNPENPSVGTKLTCVFGPEKKLPESIPEETVSRTFWSSANQSLSFRLSSTDMHKKSDNKGRQGQKTRLTLTPKADFESRLEFQTKRK